MSALNQVQLSADQQKVIEALLGEKKLDTVAKEAGVSPQQLQQWLDDDAFQAAYQSALRAATALAISRIKAGASLAVETLLKAMKDGDNSAQKIRAAKALLACADSVAERESLDCALAEMRE